MKFVISFIWCYFPLRSYNKIMRCFESDYLKYEYMRCYVYLFGPSIHTERVTFIWHREKDNRWTRTRERGGERKRRREQKWKRNEGKTPDHIYAQLFHVENSSLRATKLLRNAYRFCMHACHSYQRTSNLL